MMERRIRKIVREEIKAVLAQRAQEQMQIATEAMKMLREAIQKSQSHRVCENNQHSGNTNH